MGVFVRRESENGESLYTNPDAIRKSIEYNTRTGGSKEGKEDLIAYGGVGVTNDNPELMVEEMEEVKKVYGQKRGREMHHYTYTINREEYGQLGCCDEAIEMIAKEMAKEFFFDNGFQVEYAIHENDPGKEGYRHVHMVVNSVNYRTGKKYHENNQEYAYKKYRSNQIKDNVSTVCPIHFTDVSKMRLL